MHTKREANDEAFHILFKSGSQVVVMANVYNEGVCEPNIHGPLSQTSSSNNLLFLINFTCHVVCKYGEGELSAHIFWLLEISILCIRKAMGSIVLRAVMRYE